MVEMKDVDPAVIAEAIGMVGIVVAAVIGSVGYLYRVRLEGKRSARRLLYVLLEIRHTIIASLFDPDTATEKYITYSMNRIGSKGVSFTEGEFPPVFRELISGQFQKVVVDTKIEIESKLLPQFEEALIQVSEVNPVLAYRLRGRESLEKMISHSNDYQKEYLDLFSSVEGDEDAKQDVVKAIEKIKDEAFRKLAGDLDNDVLDLAKSCGRRDSRMCKKVLRDGFNNDNKYDFDQMDELLDRYIVEVEGAAVTMQPEAVN